ncbi:YbjQ family protein [Longirhabdus pacifica]|uniref:YbjQ family protein n=1 Tax=Longirhabdus pacifica TaxID=2305227 RepID=UPI00100894DC|nr:YbjQ family protein [Longirhabdus pacifica]
MMITTTEHMKGYEVTEVLGSTFGVVVRARGLGGDITASIKGLFGGEIKQYTQMIEDARKQAIDRMVENAAQMGGNGITMMRFDSGDVGSNMSEVVAYGTAVKIRKIVE